eukprot:COSAG06_NODE_3521_length_5231_cov_3.342362_5_plen_129_part_00
MQNLGLQELNTVKEQLEQEVKQLNASLNQLTLAGNKYRFTEEAVQSVCPENAGKSIMVPLSSSLYINGEVNDISKVMVDVGTGYFIGDSRPRPRMPPAHPPAPRRSRPPRAVRWSAGHTTPPRRTAGR